MNNQNPFIYGRPVFGKEFYNRKDELRTIFNRLRNCESTAIVGEPHVGKSSLLKQVELPEILADYLGDEAANTIPVYMDLHDIPGEYTPVDFWKAALSPLQELAHHDMEKYPKKKLDDVINTGYERSALRKLFEQLANQNIKYVLLLDEFECLLMRPKLDPNFFTHLRSMASTKGLIVISASRMDVAKMHSRGRDLGTLGSPFLNNTAEIRLRPFDQKAVASMLGQVNDQLSAHDRRFICRLTGSNPYLIQALAATFLETRGKNRQIRTAEEFYRRTSFHFDDLWETMDDKTRTTAIILSLIEFGKKSLGQKFACGEIENTEKFGPELNALADLGLAQKVDSGWQFDKNNLLLWRGEKWTISTQAFTWWARDVVVSENRQIPIYNEWLNNQRYKTFITQKQWDWLVKNVRNAPEWALRGVGALASALFQELTHQKG